MYIPVHGQYFLQEKSVRTLLEYPTSSRAVYAFFYMLAI